MFRNSNSHQTNECLKYCNLTPQCVRMQRDVQTWSAEVGTGNGGPWQVLGVVHPPEGLRRQSCSVDPGGVGGWLITSIQNLEGPFSAVTKPNLLATKCSVCKMLEDLQGWHAFAPPQTRSMQFFIAFRKRSVKFKMKCLQNVSEFSNFTKICSASFAFFEGSKEESSRSEKRSRSSMPTPLKRSQLPYLLLLLLFFLDFGNTEERR